MNNQVNNNPGQVINPVKKESGNFILVLVGLIFFILIMGIILILYFVFYLNPSSPTSLQKSVAINCVEKNLIFESVVCNYTLESSKYETNINFDFTNENNLALSKFFAVFSIEGGGLKTEVVPLSKNSKKQEFFVKLRSAPNKVNFLAIMDDETNNCKTELVSCIDLTPIEIIPQDTSDVNDSQDTSDVDDTQDDEPEGSSGSSGDESSGGSATSPPALPESML